MRLHERAAQTWAVLAWAAHHRQNMTYQQLSQATGMFTGGLGNVLALIQEYCKARQLPPLTVLVVQKDTGKPGPGFEGQDIALAQAQVFNFDWLTHGNPQPEGLIRKAAPVMDTALPEAP